MTPTITPKYEYKIIASAPGNAFFAGEHGVMLGTGAIATSIDLRTDAEIELREDNYISIDSYVLGEKLGSAEFELKGSLNALKLVSKEMELSEKLLEAFFDRFDDRKGCDITVFSKIPVESGLSSSTAFIAALYGGLALAYRHRMTNREYQSTLKPLQDFAHGGKSSGTELISSLHGGMVIVDEDGPKQYKTDFNANIGIVYTRVPRKTSYMISVAESRRAYDKTTFNEIIKGITECVEQCKIYIQSGNLELLGATMNKNHSLLRNLGVSSPELELSTNIPRTYKDVMGTKLTGAGGGKCAIILFGKDFNQEEQLKEELAKYGLSFFKTKMNVPGLQVMKV